MKLTTLLAVTAISLAPAYLITPAAGGDRKECPSTSLSSSDCSACIKNEGCQKAWYAGCYWYKGQCLGPEDKFAPRRGKSLTGNLDSEGIVLF